MSSMNAPMPPSYTYDDTHAAAADSGGQGKFLDETGAYTGTISYARAVQSSKGGWGVELGFVADDGRKPKYAPTLWTLSADGKRHFGHDILDCILICAGMKPGAAMKPGTVKYEVWDYDLRADVEKESPGYPAIAGKRIGLLLQKELYTTKKGTDGTRIAIVGAFDPETRQAASEKIENKPAEITEKRLAALKDRDTRNDRAPVLPSAPDGTAPAGTFNDFEDDLPF